MVLSYQFIPCVAGLVIAHIYKVMLLSFYTDVLRDGKMHVSLKTIVFLNCGTQQALLQEGEVKQ